jgi:Uma2 family endonuclease
MVALIQSPTKMTVEEFLALPEDGIDRELIRGEVRIRGMTVRNQFHCSATAQVAFELEAWLRTKNPRPGKVFAGELGVRLPIDDISAIGVDVAYIINEVLAEQTSASRIIQGVPTLVVEVLSPSDTMEAIDEKVELYLSAGVPMIWLVDTSDENVTVYQPNQPVIMFNNSQNLSGLSLLPGLDFPVRNLFV